MSLGETSPPGGLRVKGDVRRLGEGGYPKKSKIWGDVFCGWSLSMFDTTSGEGIALKKIIFKVNLPEFRNFSNFCSHKTLSLH